ncbi:hypothetical protein [Spiroplasma endosymbiont of Lariophagus distinguendus]|uniref:hypothetical protein n=1 Tax=Spiroplasma endosymbiont of Lariophagus distinguendus TaxID=2935082 RepID=UPI0020794CFA|nr:hypothetical protein [Spiroplasma endosymbiont of Lariophagus distinguendus]
MAKLNALLEKNGIKELSSFSKTKDFKKRTTQDMIPNTFCSRYLVDKFRKEAKEKRWSYTTLMTTILEDRYGKENTEDEND